VKLFTIGYGGRRAEDFVRLLVEHGVRTVADVRIAPERAFLGVFAKGRTAESGIEKLLGDAGIGYASLKELGNPFRDRDDWRAGYVEMLEREGEARTRRLFDLAGPVCLLCAEKLPTECHRTLVAEWLAQRGHTFEAIV
jgi:uncharacterized protein (DUF488 family)